MIATRDDEDQMPTVKVRMYATVREASGAAEVDFDAGDVEELLRGLSEWFGPRFSVMLSDDEGVVILLNGRNVRPGSFSRTRLSQRDEVSIFPPLSGG